jgi:hypothetical protein
MYIVICADLCCGVLTVSGSVLSMEEVKLARENSVKSVKPLTLGIILNMD